MYIYNIYIYAYINELEDTQETSIEQLGWNGLV